jgi:cytoskeletal protein RodZ
VFEIGNSLREARLRRGLDFAEVELATKIRGKYLRALEDEQFEILPAQTYVKGFLRTYAEYLGLDGQLYVDEFNSRFVSGEDHEPRVRRSAARPPRRNRRAETTIVLVALGLIAVLTIVVITAFKGGGGDDKTPPVAKRSGSHATPPAPLLEVTALRGSTHLTVHTTSATGSIKFDGTVQKGDPPKGIRGSRLWVAISTPENVRIRVRGTLVHVPGRQPRVIIVTPTGWRPA